MDEILNVKIGDILRFRHGPQGVFEVIEITGPLYKPYAAKAHLISGGSEVPPGPGGTYDLGIITASRFERVEDPFDSWARKVRADHEAGASLEGLS